MPDTSGALAKLSKHTDRIQNGLGNSLSKAGINEFNGFGAASAGFDANAFGKDVSRYGT